MHPDNGEGSWQEKEIRNLISTIDTLAPGVREEMSLPSKLNREWMRRPALAFFRGLSYFMRTDRASRHISVFLERS
jgi:hypothetical protein